MSLKEREDFERRLIDDGDFSEEIEAAEFDLLEEYAAGTLSSADREKITPWIGASSKRQAQVLIAQGLHRSVSARRRAPGTPWLQWTLAFTASVVLVIAISVPLLRRSQPVQPSTTPAATSVPEVPLLQDTILLVAERLRSNDDSDRSVTTYTVHAESSTRLQIMMPSSKKKAPYSLSLHIGDLQSTPVLQLYDIIPQGDASSSYLETTLPAGFLRAGVYVVEAHSQGEIYQLFFKVKDANSRLPH